MGKFYIPACYLLGLLCAAVVAFPAVASTVSVDVSPTTGYSVTNRSTVALPPRTTSGPIANYNPTLGPLAGGGAYQTTASGITITGIRDSGSASTTMSGRVNATAAAMRNGAFRCLTSFRCNVVLAGGAAGIQALLNGIDWVLGEGGRVNKVEREYNDGVSCPYSDNSYCITGNFGYTSLAGTAAQCEQYLSANYGPPTYVASYCVPSGSRWFAAGALPTRQSGGNTFYYYGRVSGIVGLWTREPLVDEIMSPVPADDIRDGVNSSYSPDPSDLPFLSTGGLDFSGPGVDFEILDIPSITGADNPTFIENSDGTSKGTYSEYDFTWSGPSKQPAVDVEETTTETTYGPSGEVISTTITTTSGSGSPANNEIEIPTDCDFMPTVCRFIDWFTEPDPELSQDPDFTQLIDTIDIEREFTVGSSTASCPAPFQISLAWVPSVEVSLQPFCDLADLLRPFLLSLCFLYSGMIILRT